MKNQRNIYAAGILTCNVVIPEAEKHVKGITDLGCFWGLFKNLSITVGA